jgi:hypothetical protein
LRQGFWLVVEVGVDGDGRFWWGGLFGDLDMGRGQLRYKAAEVEVLGAL